MKVWRALARALSRKGVRHIDLGVCQQARLLRLPNSINSKSSLYKIEMEFRELQDSDINDILDLPKEPRDLPALPPPGQNPKAAACFREAAELIEKKAAAHAKRGQWHGFAQGCRAPPCIRRIQKANLQDGIRHEAYLALSKFYGWIGTHPAEAAERIRAIDARNPIRDGNYVERVAIYGHSHGGFPGCENPALNMFCNPENCFKARLARGQKRNE